MAHQNLKNRVGEVSINFQGLKMTITEYRKAIDMAIQFEDGTVVKKTAYKEFSSGSIKNLNHPSIFGKGYMGEGKYKAWGGKSLTKEYCVWFGMLSRCYNGKTDNPTYKDVEVCSEWLNFQIFATWFEINYREGFALDKDIICPDCRTYSPQTCVFVPQEINSMFTSAGKTKRDLPVGIYYLRGRYQVSTPNHDGSTYVGFYKSLEEARIVNKDCKEKYMKKMAEIWEGRVDSRVYNIMCNWVFEENI